MPSGTPMSADANLPSDDMSVECVLEHFERKRVAIKLSDLVVSKIAGESSGGQFLEVAGLQSARGRVTYELLKLGKGLNDSHIVETFSQHKTMATASCMGLTL